MGDDDNTKGTKIDDLKEKIISNGKDYNDDN